MDIQEEQKERRDSGYLFFFFYLFFWTSSIKRTNNQNHVRVGGERKWVRDTTRRKKETKRGAGGGQKWVECRYFSVQVRVWHHWVCNCSGVCVVFIFYFYHSVPETVILCFLSASASSSFGVWKCFFSSLSVACFSLHYSIISLLIYLSGFFFYNFIFAGPPSGCTWTIPLKLQ